MLLVKITLNAIEHAIAVKAVRAAMVEAEEAEGGDSEWSERGQECLDDLTLQKVGDTVTMEAPVFGFLMEAITGTKLQKRFDKTIEV